MSTSRRIVIWLLVGSLLIVIGFGLLALWGYRSIQSVVAGPPPLQYDTPTELANISVPSRPFALAWSADGSFIAAGTHYNDQNEVFVVDVAKASVTTTLKITGDVEALAFSPDGMCLAVGTVPSLHAGEAAADLIVFDISTSTAKFTAKGSKPKSGFLDLAWAADGKALCAIDGPALSPEKKEIRRWSVPAFSEQPAISSPQTGKYVALAVSPDGHTLAVADEPFAVASRVVRLFDLGKGAERSSFEANQPMDRLGFTPDGKAVGIYANVHLSWWDVATGKKAKPDPARFALQPAGLSDVQRSHYSMLPDGSKVAQGEAVLHGFGAFSFGKDNRFGAFVYVTDTATGKKLTWRVGEAAGVTDSPVVAFSPDGKKLAGTVTQPNGQSIVIWAVPK